ncbi:MAG: 6-phosphogluconolactonase [Candidatus Saccharimonadales bacterium]
MQLLKIDSPEQATETLVAALKAALEKQPAVTWLVPGGSNIAITVAAMAGLPDALTEKLIIAQTDERYGELGHQDSNWRQLIEAGFQLKKAKALPILTNEPLSLQGTATRYAKNIGELIMLTYKIGQFGIGPDGHIAGIKPDSPAAVANGLAVGYQAEDFERVTITFGAIRQLDEAFAFVFGESKRATLEALANEHHQPLLQPAQILKSLSNSLVYNDQIAG